jgi:DNA-binding NarL/FixJ family response regulator
MNPRTVILAAAQPLFREGLQSVLAAHDLTVVAEAADADTAVAAAERHHAGICIMDGDLPGGGILAVRRITYRVPETAVVVLAPDLDSETVLAAVRAGANGILATTTTGAGLIRAVESVLDGQASLPRSTIATLIHELRGGAGRHTSVDGSPLLLTEREAQVLELLRENLTTAQIARELGVSQVTVRRHLSAVAAKIGGGRPRELLRLVRVA